MIRLLANRPPVAPPPGLRRDVGCDCDPAPGAGRRRRQNRLVGQRGLHDQPRPPARDEHHPPHSRLGRITAMRLTSPPTMPLGDHAAGCRQKFTPSSTATACRWWCSSGPARVGETRCASPCWKTCACRVPAGDGERAWMNFAPTKPSHPVRYATICANAVSPRRSPSLQTASPTANAKDPAAADHRHSTPSRAKAAMSSSAGSVTSSSGAAWQPDTTNTHSSTGQASSSLPPSHGSKFYETRPRRPTGATRDSTHHTPAGYHTPCRY